MNEEQKKETLQFITSLESSWMELNPNAETIIVKRGLTETFSIRRAQDNSHYLVNEVKKVVLPFGTELKIALDCMEVLEDELNDIFDRLASYGARKSY